MHAVCRLPLSEQPERLYSQTLEVPGVYAEAKGKVGVPRPKMVHRCVSRWALLDIKSSLPLKLEPPAEKIRLFARPARRQMKVLYIQGVQNTCRTQGTKSFKTKNNDPEPFFCKAPCSEHGQPPVVYVARCLQFPRGVTPGLTLNTKK